MIADLMMVQQILDVDFTSFYLYQKVSKINVDYAIIIQVCISSGRTQ